MSWFEEIALLMSGDRVEIGRLERFKVCPCPKIGDRPTGRIELFLF